MSYYVSHMHLFFFFLILNTEAYHACVQYEYLYLRILKNYHYPSFAVFAGVGFTVQFSVSSKIQFMHGLDDQITTDQLIS